MKRMRAAAAVAIRINAVILVSICCSLGSSLGSSPAWAMIDCMSAPGEPKVGARYFWREIDGRKCWFLRTGDIPPKSQLRWPKKAEKVEPEEVEPEKDARPEEPSAVATDRRDERPESVAVTPPPAETPERLQPSSEPRPSSQLRFRTARVKPVAAPALNLGHGLDLLNGTSLTANTPPSLAPADPFHARFTGRRD
jgi:hypothetical protein